MKSRELILLTIGLSAAFVAAAGIEVSAPGGRIVFSEKDGSIEGVYAGKSSQPIWRGGDYGLWRLRFRDGSWLDAARFSELPNAVIRVQPKDGGFCGLWEVPNVKVRVAVSPFGRGVEFRADVEVRGERTVRELTLPAQLRFDPKSVQGFTVASCRSEGPGITFNRGFFEKAAKPHEAKGRYYNGPDYFKYETVYPAAFSDFQRMETPSGESLALYGVQARGPHEPWANPKPFQPTRYSCGGDAAGGFLSHGFILWHRQGETYRSPAVRLAFGGSLFDALDAYALENGLVKPLAEKMDAKKLETLKRGLFLRFRGPSSARSRELLSLMPHPFTLHTTNYLRRPQDEAPPDWFPVSEKYGGDAGLRALIDDLHARGDLFCPYTNPTFWSDMPPRGPYFASVGEAPLARFENGKPRPEGYSDGNSSSHGWTPCLWHEAVKAINRKNRDRCVSEFPVDLLFQDQCGSRGWVEDFNPSAPSPIAYTEGMLSMVEEDAKVLPLGTEDGWDRVANEETALFGINGKMMMLDPVDPGETVRPALKTFIPPDIWRWEGVASRLMHEKCLFMFHDLGPHVTNPRHLAWALGCGFGLSAYVYDDFDGDKPWQRKRRNWIRWLDVLQQNVARRYAGAKTVAFRHDRTPLLALRGGRDGEGAVATRVDDGVIVAQYGDMTVKANLGDVARLVEGEMLAPYGFSIRAPGLRAAALDGEEPYVEADGKRTTQADCGFAKTAEPDLMAMTCPAIFIGNDHTAYRDPAVYEKDGNFFLFYTVVEIEKTGGIYSYTAESESRNLLDWTKPRILTPRDQNLNYSSPGNVVKDGDEYVLCLQTYPRPGNTVTNMPMFADETARLYTMRSKDLRTWSAPELLRVKGPDVPFEKMGRMIDPYLLRDRDDPGKWWCFFKQNGASRAHSRDLKAWTFDGRVPAGENACVVVKDGEYVLFHSPQNGIAVKRSRDLVNWKDDPKLITLGQAGWNWAKGRITAGTVIDARHVKGVGKYLMFFHGSGPKKEIEGDFDRNASIGIAWSDDLEHWDWPKGRSRDWTPCRGTETAALQARIDALAAQGGGTLTMPKGVHPTGALFFKPGVNLHLDEGAVLLGSDDGADYPLRETRIEGETCRYYPALINADGCDGFTITGRGTVDGHGFATWEEFWRRLKEAREKTGNADAFKNKDLMRPRVLYVSNSKNVDVSGVTFKNAKFWTTHFYQCENVVVRDCTFLADVTKDSRGRVLKGPSTDAVDIDKCRNFTVRGCRISVNDDGVVVKGGKGAWANDYAKHPENGPSSNVLVEDCVFQAPTHSCLTLGSECPEAHGVVMRNCRMEGAGDILYLKMRTDTPQRYSDVLVEGMTGRCETFLHAGAWAQYADFGGRTPAELKSHATNVVIRNCRVTCRVERNVREDPNVFELKGLKLENNEIH